MSKAKVSWQPSSKLEIRYTSNIGGELEALPYLATVIKQQRAQCPDMLLFDTGSFSGPGCPGPNSGEPHVKVYNHLQYTAVVPGRAEAMDTKALKKMARMANFPFLATNWRGIGEGDYFTNRQVIETVPATQALDEALKGFDPADTVVIILSQLDGNQNLALAKHGNFTKVIIGGVTIAGLDQTMSVGNSLIAPASDGPKSLGSLTVNLGGNLKVNKEKESAE